MSINTARRGFLRLLPAIPFGATAAAKEAAASMGLSGPIGVSSANALYGHGLSASPDVIGDGKPWCLRMLETFDDPQTLAEQRREAAATARTLDSDIAALQSVSPAAKYRLQLDRTLAVIRRERKAGLEREWEQIKHQYPMLSVLSA